MQCHGSEVPRQVKVVLMDNGRWGHPVARPKTAPRRLIAHLKHTSTSYLPTSYPKHPSLPTTPRRAARFAAFPDPKDFPPPRRTNELTPSGKTPSVSLHDEHQGPPQLPPPRGAREGREGSRRRGLLLRPRGLGGSVDEQLERHDPGAAARTSPTSHRREQSEQSEQSESPPELAS